MSHPDEPAEGPRDDELPPGAQRPGRGDDPDRADGAETPANPASDEQPAFADPDPISRRELAEPHNAEVDSAGS